MGPRTCKNLILYFLTCWKTQLLGTLKFVLNFGLKCYLIPINDYISYMNVCCDICSNGSHFEYHFEKKSVHHICQDFQLKENDPKDKEHILGVHFHQVLLIAEKLS